MAAVGLALALTATACGGGGDTDNEAANDPAAEGKKGGTLYILNAADFEHLDPARNYVGTAWDMSRVFIRTLNTYKAAPGDQGSEIVPDLATDTGRSSDGAKTWTFTLKDNLKFEDGTPITSKDIKYGVERTFSADLPEGPAYQRQWLVGGENYKGPYVDKNPAGLASIQTPDDKTIVFKLNRPVGDFPYMATFPLMSPVPRAKDNGVTYDNHPVASGPYKIQSYQRGKQMTLVRNEHWDPETDEVRKANPDKIQVLMGLDQSVIDQRIIGSRGEDANAVNLDTTLDPSNLALVENDPRVKERSAGGPTGYSRYLWMNTTKKPFDNVKVRQAMNYLVNKDSYRTARGGPLGGGDYASTILAPTVPGHQDFNLYEAPPEGNVDKAKELLAEAGFPNGFSTQLISTNEGKGVTQATAVQESLARANIKAEIISVDASVYFTTIGEAAKSPALGFASWAPDWPSASTVIPPLFDGRLIQPQGNQNFSQYNNPEVNERIDEISAMTDPEEAQKAWGELDERIMEDAPWVPLVFERGIDLWGSNVKGAYKHQFYGHLDIAALSVK